MRDNLQRYEEATKIVKRPRTSHSALTTHRRKKDGALLLEPGGIRFWRQSHLEVSLPFSQRTQPAPSDFLERNLRAIPHTLSAVSSQTRAPHWPSRRETPARHGDPEAFYL